MINCKKPNNGGNVLVKRDNKIILMDQSLNEVSAVELPEIPEPPDISGKLDKSEAKEEYAHGLTLDGSTLKLMNNESTPQTLASVELPAPSGGGSGIHAHAMALYFNGMWEEDCYVKCEYDADGIRIKAHTTLDSAVLRFEVELIAPTKFVFDPAKPVYWRYYAYNSSLQVYEPVGSAKNTYIPALVTPADATSPLLCTQSLDWQTYDTDRVIIEVFAELVEAGGE